MLKSFPGTPRAEEPSRHGPGHNLFIYFPDPDGNVIEIFTELDRIHEGDRYQPRVWSSEEAASVWSRYPAPAEFLEAVEAVGLAANKKTAALREKIS